MRVRMTVNGAERIADDAWAGESRCTCCASGSPPGSKNACEQGMRLVHGITGRGRGVRLPVAAGQAQDREVRPVEGPGAGPASGSGAAGYWRPGAVNVDSVHPAGGRHARPAAAATEPAASGDPRALAGKPVPVHGYERSWRRCAGPPQRSMSGHRRRRRATVDDAGTEYATVCGDRGRGSPKPAPARRTSSPSVRGCARLPGTPGMVTPTTLYQWPPAGRRRFGSLPLAVTLYRCGGAGRENGGAAAAAGLARLAPPGAPRSPTTHYVSRGRRRRVRRAGGRGTRSGPAGGVAARWTAASGRGLPRSLVETLPGRSTVRRRRSSGPTTRRSARGYGSRRAVLAVSVSTELMREAPRWPAAPVSGAHPPGETLTRRSMPAEFGARRSVRRRVGFLAATVWLAHGVHLDEGPVALLAARQPGSRTAPPRTRGSLRIAPVWPAARGRRAGRLGVDGAASNEAVG